MSQRYDFFLSFSSFVFQYFYFLLLLIDKIMFRFVTMNLVIMFYLITSITPLRCTFPVWPLAENR